MDKTDIYHIIPKGILTNYEKHYIKRKINVRNYEGSNSFGSERWYYVGKFKGRVQTKARPPSNQTHSAI